MKPIFVIKLPQGDLSPMVITECIQRTKKHLDQDPISDDYHILVIADKSDRIEFECFNTPITETKIEELQKYLTRKIELINK